jgi:hypothetical protein
MRRAEVRVLIASFLAFWCCASLSQVAPLSTHIGAQLLITPESVTSQGGCSTKREIALRENHLVVPNEVCDFTVVAPQMSAARVCEKDRLRLIRVQIRGIQKTVLLESIFISKTVFHARLFNELSDIHGATESIERIEAIVFCAGIEPETNQVFPSTICVEPRQFAVNFDYGTPLSNKILTNGFSFFIRYKGNPPSNFELERTADDVRDAFQLASSIWFNALFDFDRLLTPEIRSFVASRTARSEGGRYLLLTPPQVIMLKCPNAANFVIEINFGGDGLFPGFPSPVVLAKGRLEGRTIALNLRDVECYRSIAEGATGGRLVLEVDGCTNLIPVLTHELGHAFGISHLRLEQGAALMNPSLSTQALQPTEHDVRALVEVLHKSIVGAAPGILEFRSSEGVLAPTDWLGPASRRIK